MISSDSPVAVVTGAGRGVGRAVALGLARRGYRLTLAARSREELEQTRHLSGLVPADSLIVLIDLADIDAPANLVETALDRYGRLDLLVNNAGWAPPRRALIKVTDDEQDRMIATNLRAPIALSRLAARHMIRHGGGTLINIASVAARTSPAGEAIYAATKAGLVAFTHASFAELREHNVRVSVVLPGLTDTALIPKNKLLERGLMLSPDDVAGAVFQILDSPPNSCPLELTVVPQRNPERRAAT